MKRARKTPKYHFIEKLESRYGSLKMLVLLFEEGELTFTDFSEFGMNDNTIKESRVFLENEKLIIRYPPDESKPRMKNLKLTEKGERVAQYIAKLEEAMKD